MKNTLLPFALIAITFLSSCDRNLYNYCASDKAVFQNENVLLVKQNNIINAKQSLAKKVNDSLNTYFNTLAQENENLKSENTKLIELENSEIENVNKYMIAYFTKVAKITADQLPPCPNAANGHFRNNMTNSDIRALANPQIVLSTRKANNLLDAFKGFSSRNQLAFINNENYDPGDWVAFRIWTLDYLSQIKTALLDIISIINSDGKDDKKNAQAAVDAAKFYQDVSKNSNCHSGRHANGHISSGVKEAARFGLTKLDSYSFDNTSTKIGKEAHILEGTFNALMSLQTEGHDPWLRADWQLKYYTIMRATALSLSALK